MKAISEDTIGGRIRKARVSRKLTTRELAEKVGVSQNYLSVVERNDNKQASPALLQKIADFTGVSLTWLKYGDSTISEAAQFTDIQLLLTLVMQQEPTITKEVIATILNIGVETVEGILSRKTEYDPQWASGLSILVQRLDLPFLRKKIRSLDAFLQQEEERKNGIDVFWALRSYFSKKFKADFTFASQPITLDSVPTCILFVLQCENTFNLKENWYIYYYPFALEPDEMECIYERAMELTEAGEENHKNVPSYRVIAAFSDKGTYRRACDLFRKKGSNVEDREEWQALQGLLISNPPKEIETECILINKETTKIEKMEQPYTYPYEDEAWT